MRVDGLRHMRNYPGGAAVGDEGGSVVGLVSAHRLVACAGRRLQHRQRRRWLRHPGGLRQAYVHHQAAAVLHHQIPGERQLGSFAVGLARQLGIRIGGRGVRLVRALLLAEVAFAVVSGCRWFVVAVLAAEAFHAGPRLDQRAVDREMFIRQQRLDSRQVQHRGHERRHDLALQRPVVVVVEHRRRPNRIVH